MENTCGFVHLHTHTMYSLLDGAIRPKELIAKAAEWGMGAAAVTDHGNMFGAVEFYLRANAAGIKPIIGAEVYVAIEGMGVKKAARGNIDGANHLVLLAADSEGYRNLMKIVSAGYTEGFYYKPRVDKPLLRRYAGGIIALTACIGGEVPQLVLQGRPDQAEAVAREYADIFGEGNFYLELQRHGIPEEQVANEGLIDISRRTGIPLVATNDAHYLQQEHADTHEVLLCISTGKTLKDPNRMKMATNQLHLRTPDEMNELFSDIPEALANTVAIAERCHVEIETGTYHTVKFDLPAGFEGTTDDYLARIAEEGLRRRYGDGAEQHLDRMKYELDIIRRMGFSDYFLAIYDCTRAAGEMGIPVGTARGSAGGSIVAYAIGITNLDPMQFGLIFERFLNPERVSMPDFDVDYADRDRPRMIEYVKHKYGGDHVCQIITFGSMKAKLVVRDVGRVMGMSYGEVDVIAKLIPGELGITIKDALEKVPELRDMEAKNPQYHELFRHARILEGLSRHAGTHAAGVVITPGPVTEYMPLYVQGTDLTCQYTMEYVDKIGCLKVDFLGLRTLTVIKDAVDLARTKGAEINLDTLPLDDPAVYDLMGRGETVGVFQFESGGMREYLKKLQPTCIEDLIAMNALYRPGPLGSHMVDDFIDRKHGRKPIVYPHPLLEDILRETYGVIVYQEQVMKIANVLAGFSLGAADELRRAMGKKKVEVMAKMREQFVDGARERGISDRIAGDVFELMAHFAGYGFNKSHSAGYAILAYQTAWLKAHHPAEFMAAALTSEMDNTDRVVILIEECRSMGIEVLPPDVNHSHVEFTVEGNDVRFGLGGVKNVGRGAIEVIIAARTDGGTFDDLFDFCVRVDLSALNRRVIESLIHAGAFDSTGADRAQLIAAAPDAVEFSQARQRERDMGQFSLFGELDDPGAAGATPPLPGVEPWTRMERLAHEKSVLGFWFSGHPLEGYREELRAFTMAIPQLATRPDRSQVTIGGVITSVARKTRKKDNKPYLNLRVEDMDGSTDVILMNGAFDAYKDTIAEDALVLIQGTVSNRGDDQPSIFADAVEPLDDARRNRTRAVNIAVDTTAIDRAGLKPAAEVCDRYPGDLTLWIQVRTPSCGTFRVKSKHFRVANDPALLKDLRTVLGRDRVWIS